MWVKENYLLHHDADDQFKDDSVELRQDLRVGPASPLAGIKAQHEKRQVDCGLVDENSEDQVSKSLRVDRLVCPRLDLVFSQESRFVRHIQIGVDAAHRPENSTGNDKRTPDTKRVIVVTWKGIMW